MYGGVWMGACVCVCECLRKSLKDSPRQGKKPSNRKQAEVAGSGQAELKMLKHCLTQRAPLEFHLPPARTHSYSHTQTYSAPAASWEKMRQLSPLEQSLAGSGNLLPATKLRSAGHLHFGLRCVCVFVCTCFSLYEWVCVWIVKTLWLVLFRMALYCCIFYFATKCIKHKIYCEFTNAVLWFFIAEHLTAFRGWGE